ncbi:GT2 family glycosyltransferase [Nicoletella semolina]|uniref:GT2 family glycosyltransferase n=1 Tax=Nicoletella semolina TaxID=271160 RepID=A0A4R2NCS2_9PAST|nr:glycosyltransferase [Nicoletella semolina]MDH2924234.1 glycosyltransferase [Nicoletella semolina]TCP18868.1 GT2 family glycosyltransferase [Nicoletella semolina]
MFSIIIPSYNRVNEIPALLNSLMLQKRQNFEVIIIDDCSNEAVKLSQEYPFSVNVIRNQQNLGAAQSRNVGVYYARYDWLLFLDDDDRFRSDKTAVLATVIENNPNANFIYHKAECVMVNENFHYLTRPLAENEISLNTMLQANKIGGIPMIAIRKSFFIEVEGFSKNLLSLEDYEFILKLIASNKLNAKYIDEALTICTFHTKRASVSTNTMQTNNAIEYIRKKYVKNIEQAKCFKINALYMLAYPHIMNLSRKAAKYYFLIFKESTKLKYLLIAIIVFISPKLAIHLKRFI